MNAPLLIGTGRGAVLFTNPGLRGAEWAYRWIRRSIREPSEEWRILMVVVPVVCWLALFVGLAFSGSRAGLIVGATIVGLGVMVVGVVLWRIMRGSVSSSSRAFALGAMGAAIGVGLHSLLDFGLTMPANAFSLAVVIGAALGAAREYPKNLWETGHRRLIRQSRFRTRAPRPN